MWWTDWQMIVALLCVAAAAAAIIKRSRDWLNGSTESGCHSCPAQNSQTVVPINSLKLSPSLKARQAQSGRDDAITATPKPSETK